MNRFQKHYENIVCYDLLFKDYFINVMQLPKVDQITINTGIGLGAVLDKRRILTTLLGLELLSGQRPETTRAKKSIDKFKLREKMPIGCKVTLRNKPLHIFIDRLVNFALPNMLNEANKGNSGIYKKCAGYRSQIESLSSRVSGPSHKQQEAELHDLSARKEATTKLLRSFRALSDIGSQAFAAESTFLLKSSSSDNISPSTSAISMTPTRVEQIAAFMAKHKRFVPRGRDYFFLSKICGDFPEKPLRVQASLNFLLDHNFFFAGLSADNQKKKFGAPLGTRYQTGLCLLRRQRTVPSTPLRILKKERYSISFGIENVSVFANSNPAHFEVSHSHGLDIIFGVGQGGTKGRRLSKPQYLLSSFQMPFI